MISQQNLFDRAIELYQQLDIEPFKINREHIIDELDCIHWETMMVTREDVSRMILAKWAYSPFNSYAFGLSIVEDGNGFQVAFKCVGIHKAFITKPNQISVFMKFVNREILNKLKTDLEESWSSGYDSESAENYRRDLAEKIDSAEVLLNDQD